MGGSKRTRKKDRKNCVIDSDDELMTKRLSAIVPKKTLYQRLKNRDRKKKLKRSKVDFADLCKESIVVEPVIFPIHRLPSSLPSQSPSLESTSIIAEVLRKKAQILENRPHEYTLAEIYRGDAYVSLQTAPFAGSHNACISEKANMNHEDRKDVIKSDSLAPFMTFSSNLLKGSWPLESWAWALENGQKEPGLSKLKKKNLRLSRQMQDSCIKQYKRLSKRKLSIHSLECTHSTIRYARGLGDIEKLFTNIPVLLTIPSDEVCNFDVIDHGSESMCVQYRTLCLEIMPEQAKNASSILLHSPKVRWVVSLMILSLQPATRIVNETLSILPVSEEQQLKYVAVIRKATERWVEMRESSMSDSASSRASHDAELIANFSNMTFMNYELSERYLRQCGWNINQALDAFRRSKTGEEQI